MTESGHGPTLPHRLPAAPHFVGREQELATLRALWSSGAAGVWALVGLGGSGKTAVAARFLEELPSIEPRPEGVFVWSFYLEPDAGYFLQELFRWLVPAGAPTEARGGGLFHLIRDALAQGGRRLLVLDGLERVQRPDDSGGPHGQVEDPLLRGLLTRVAEALGQTVALVTSRFPLTDLTACRGHGYCEIDVGGLSAEAARELLRARGVSGSDGELRGIVLTYGAHALTLDHVGGLIGQFLGGDPRRAPEAPALATPGSDRQALRLARLLEAYEKHLPQAELDLLARLSLVRRNVSEEQSAELFLCSPAVRPRTAREAAGLCERFPGLNANFESNGIKDLAKSVEQVIEQAVCAAPAAGPEDRFLTEVREALVSALDEAKHLDSDRLEQTSALYADHLDEDPSDLRPLPPEDRRLLILSHRRYIALRENPLLPVAEPGVKKAAWPAGKAIKYGPPLARGVGADVTPADVLAAFRIARRRAHYLVIKHGLLLRVRALCRQAQAKWSLAGAVATLDREGLKAALESLRERHLIVCEADGSYSVHPALRDHFGRLAPGQREQVHDALRVRLLTLVRRPGRRLPEDRVTLDLIEEAIYHALEAGKAADAWSLFEQGLGGLRHLGWKLGDVARGLRILRRFEPCPDRWSLGWFHRALGELEPAYALNPLPYFRADIRLLQGRLPEVAAEGDDARTATARFLMGQTTALPSSVLGAAVPRAQILLYLGRLERTPPLTKLYQEMGFEGDRARVLMLGAEAARRRADRAQRERLLSEASAWTTRSGSVEHLCLFHLVRARSARDAGELAAARGAVDEGVHLAAECGLGLYHIKLLCERARVCLVAGEAAAAEVAAREALARAVDRSCRFLWGAAEAAELLGVARAASGRKAEAVAALKKAVALRRRIGDPRLSETERQLAQQLK